MSRLAIVVLFAFGCSSAGGTSHDAAPVADGAETTEADAAMDADAAADGDAPDTADAADAGCPLPHEPNALRLIQSANAQPAWVEIEATILFDDPPFDWAALGTTSGADRDALLAKRAADLAPIEDDLEARLRAIGARNIGRSTLTASVNAVVTAGALPQIPCWPHVTEIDGSGLTTTGGAPGDDCLASAACDGTCGPLDGDVVDPSRGCAQRGVPLACLTRAVPYDDALTCYVELATGRAFAAKNPWLVDLADKGVRKCTRAEGGPTAPSLLPTCP